VKRLILGTVAATAAATAAVLVPQAAGATGSSGGSHVSINQYADFNFAGGQLDLGLNVSCTGGSGTVNVSVHQDYPETWAITGADGAGAQVVVCDGRTRYVTVTIVGAPYDGGKATATAMLVAPSGNVTAKRQISIRAT
jgi:hypothetical protein